MGSKSERVIGRLSESRQRVGESATLRWATGSCSPARRCAAEKGGARQESPRICEMDDRPMSRDEPPRPLAVTQTAHIAYFKGRIFYLFNIFRMVVILDSILFLRSRRNRALYNSIARESLIVREATTYSRGVC